MRVKIYYFLLVETVKDAIAAHSIAIVEARALHQPFGIWSFIDSVQKEAAWPFASEGKAVA